MVQIGDLLDELINLSEKAAKVARFIREQNELFKLLVEEKKDDKNVKFVQDFKTLTDVLIQEMIKFYLNKKYPKITTIKGEENNKFTNSKGTVFEIELKNDPKELEKVLNEILIDQPNASKLLVDIVYKEVSKSSKSIKIHQQLKVDVKLEKIGIYIDPIDCTNEYVKGKWDPNEPFPVSGLSCVCCLIGAYLKDDGNSIIGVVNLPFYHSEGNNTYTGKYIYGVHYKNINVNNIESIVKSCPSKKGNKLRVVVSSAESEAVTDKLGEDYILSYVSGVGYKLFLVLTNQADIFFTLKPTTFRWDSCPFSAIFKSIKSRKDPKQSGCLLELKNLIIDSPVKDYSKYELNYDSEEDNVNKNGLIATLDINLVDGILIKLKS